jgi:hypothetical protein
MYITLSNAAEAHKGNKIAINTSLIATVHQTTVKQDDGIIGHVTYIFCPPHGTWEVSESLEDVVKELNSLEWNKK